MLAASAYLVVVSLFGGGLVQWGPSYILLILATMALALFFAFRDGFVVFERTPLLVRVALAGIAVLPLLQLVPLPPTAWHALPGQELRLATLGMAGIADSWQPLSLEPVSTALCAVLAIGFVTFVGVLLRLNDRDFRRLLAATFALIALGVAAGLLQVVTDGQFPRFFSAQQGATLLGFFANKNHMALAIACSILLIGLVFRQDRPVSYRRQFVVVGYALFALVCIVATNSRAGLGLGLLSAAIVLVHVSRGIALRWRVAALVAIAVATLAVVTSSAFEIVASRFNDTGDDLRWQFAAWSLPLAKQYLMLGSGLGAFKTVFQAHEHLDWLMPVFVNAVHNDYLQLVIEAGLPGLLVLLALLMSLVQCAVTWRTLPRRDPRRRDMAFGYAVIVLFALHSGLDYPLRRPAAWIIFAIALASVYRPATRSGATPGPAEAA